jgi:hypothetical protein
MSSIAYAQGMPANEGAAGLEHHHAGAADGRMAAHA